MKKTYSMSNKFVAALTAVGLASVGCASSAEDTPIAGDPGDRQVTAEVLMNMPDETGARTVKPLGSETFALADYASWDRALVVDGVETHDLAALRSGSEIVVPLNTGETATLVRRGDRLELESFTGEDDGAGESPRGAVGAVELLPAEYHVYLAGSDGSAPDTMVRLSGVEDLPEEAADLVTALALQTLLSTLEDQEQIAPAVAIAAIAAVVAAGWLTICGQFAFDCATQCEAYAGFETQCAGLTVSLEPVTVVAGGGYSCRCL